MTLFWMLFAANGGTAPVVPAAAPADETIVVSATSTRLTVPASDLGSGVTEIGREDFEARHPARLADVLRNVPGVHVDQVGGRGGTSSLYLRGADPNYTLVLVDGVRVNDPTNARGGSFDFSVFDVDDVERIEIARGPYSAVFGGDALAGVVNIVTRPGLASGTRASIDAMGGAHGTREVALRAAGSGEGRRWTVGVLDAREGATVRGNDFASRRVSASYDAGIGDTRVQLSGRYAETERAGFPDDSGGYRFAAIRQTERRDAQESLFSAALTRGFGSGSLGLTLGWFERDERTDSPGVAPGVRDPFGVPPSVVDAGISRFTTAVTGKHFFDAAGLELAYGAEYQREEGTSHGELDFGGGFVLPTSFDLTRASFAPFAEVRLGGPDAWSLQAGVRVDDPDGYSAVTSPRVRLAYGFDAGAMQGLTLAAAWGKGFKLPSLYALGHPLVGNPALVPERSESYELELSQELGGGARWSLTWFDSEYRNAIDFDSGPPPMLVNRNRVDSQGFELAGALERREWSLDLSVTQARSRIASTNAELRNRPEWRAGAGVQWQPLDGLTLSANASYVGSSFDSSIATGDVRLPSYTLLDVAATWQLPGDWEAWVAIDNLTDERYQQFVGFEARGILPRAGVRFTL